MLLKFINYKLKLTACFFQKKGFLRILLGFSFLDIFKMSNFYFMKNNFLEKIRFFDSYHFGNILF